MAKNLEKRIERIEAILFNLATHKNRCKYIYVKDLLDIMERQGMIITTERYKRGI